MSKNLASFVHHGEIKDGKLVLDNDSYWKGMIATFNDCKVRIVLERKRGTRTQAQNRYYWGVVLDLISQHTGFLPEELHEIFRAKFLRNKHVWRGANVITLKSTASLKSDEFSEYIDQVREEGAEMGVVIPDADPDYYVKEEFDL